MTPLLFSVKSQDPTSLVPCPINLSSEPTTRSPKLHGFKEADGQDPSLPQVPNLCTHRKARNNSHLHNSLFGPSALNMQPLCKPVSEASHYDSLAAVGRPRNLPTSIRAETHEPLGRIDDVTVAAYRIYLNFGCWPSDHTTTLPKSKGSRNKGYYVWAAVPVGLPF